MAGETHCEYCLSQQQTGGPTTGDDCPGVVGRPPGYAEHAMRDEAQRDVAAEQRAAALEPTLRGIRLLSDARNHHQPADPSANEAARLVEAARRWVEADAAAANHRCERCGGFISDSCADKDRLSDAAWRALHNLKAAALAAARPEGER